MNVNLFLYQESDWLRKTKDSDYYSYPQVISSRYAKKILQDVSGGVATEVLSISEKLINDRSSRHVDKWIEETALHMSNYSSLAQPNLIKPLGVRSSKHKKILKIKNLSGDVSGVIGESIFSSILIDRYKLKDTDFAHYGADRRTGIFPDFGIYNLGFELEKELNWTKKITLPMPAEVKTVSNLIESQIKSKLEKATNQILNFQSVTKSLRHAAMICLVLRNFSNKSYDVALMQIE